MIQLKKSCSLPAVFSQRLATQFSCRQYLDLQDVKMTLGLLKEKQVTAHFIPVLPLALLHILPSHDLLDPRQVCFATWLSYELHERWKTWVNRQHICTISKSQQDSSNCSCPEIPDGCWWKRIGFSKCEFCWTMNILINTRYLLARAFITYFINACVYISKYLCSISKHVYILYINMYLCGFSFRSPWKLCWTYLQRKRCIWNISLTAQGWCDLMTFPPAGWIIILAECESK